MKKILVACGAGVCTSTVALQKLKTAMEQLPAAILRSINIIPQISKITSATHFPMTAKLSEKTRITSVIAVSIIALMPRNSEAPSTRMSL